MNASLTVSAHPQWLSCSGLPCGDQYLNRKHERATIARGWKIVFMQLRRRRPPWLAVERKQSPEGDTFPYYSHLIIIGEPPMHVMLAHLQCPPLWQGCGWQSSILCSHRCPLKPELHSQMKAFTASVHTAPFWHGPSAQSSMFISQVFPVQPAEYG